MLRSDILVFLLVGATVLSSCSKGTGSSGAGGAGGSNAAGTGGPAGASGAAGTTGTQGSAGGGGTVSTAGTTGAGGAAGGMGGTGGGVVTCVAGGSCPTPGASCTNSSGQLCSCVGPPGAAYITCDVTGGGGTSGGGGVAGTGTSSGSGGAAGRGGVSGSGGAAGTGGSASTLGRLCTGVAPWTTSGTPATRITVDAAQRGSAWNRYYEMMVAADHANTILTTAWGRNIQGALRKGRDQAGFRYARFHGMLNSDIGVYGETNGTPVYNWTRLDMVYDAVIAAGMRPFVEIGFMPPPLAASPVETLHWYNGAPAIINPPKDWNRWMDFMAALVQHLEQRYGVDEVRNNWYFEVWNEASWMYTLGQPGYNELYGYTARGLARGDANIKIGGPAESGGGSMWGIMGLVDYARTNSLKLDFVTYHTYGQDSDTNVVLSIPTIAFHGTMINTVRMVNFTGPVFATEWGGSYSTHVTRDNEVAASFIAKTVAGIGTHATVAPPSGYAYWTISDLYEEIDTGTALAYREGNYGLLLKGDPRYPESFDVPKPAFNAFRILHMMGDVRISATGGTANNGVNAAATVTGDNSAVQVLVYNHTDGGAANSSSSSLVNVTINGLPFGASPVRVRHYVVDRTRSNSYTTWVGMGKPAQPTQAQWVALRDAGELCYYETMATPSGNAYSVMFPQNNYSAGLLVLSR